MGQMRCSSNLPMNRFVPRKPNAQGRPPFHERRRAERRPSRGPSGIVVADDGELPVTHSLRARLLVPGQIPARNDSGERTAVIRRRTTLVCRYRSEHSQGLGRRRASERAKRAARKRTKTKVRRSCCSGPASSMLSSRGYSHVDSFVKCKVNR